MRNDRHVVGRLDHLGGCRHRGIDIAVVTRVGALLVERVQIGLAELRAVGRAGGADLPLDREHVERGLRAPMPVGDHRDGLLELDHLHDAAAAGNRAFVDRLHRAAEHRAGHDRRMHHVGHVKVDAVLCGAVDLERHVEPRKPPADELELIGLLDRGLLVELDRGRLDRQLAVSKRAAGRFVGDLTHRRRAIGRRHVPAPRRRSDEAFACARPRLLDHLAGLAHGAAPAGAQAAIDLVVPEIAVGRGVFRFHQGPIAFELFGENLRQSREGALPHLGAAVADDHAVIGIDHDPGVDLASARKVVAPGAHAQGCSLSGTSDSNAERKPAGGGERGGDELAAGDLMHDRHGSSPAQIFISAAAR